MGMKVRIALVVNENGHYNAVGWSGSDKDPVGDEVMMGTCVDGLEEFGHEARYWVEVEVERPVVKVVEGQVEEVEEG